MGCQQSKRSADVAADAQSLVMRPSTPSFLPRESLAARASSEPGASDARQGEELEELPSFVLSTTSDLIKSSDSEAVQGMVGAFTFSFIQVSESSVSSSSGLESSSASASDDDKQSEVDGDVGESAAEQMPPIPEEGAEHKEEQEEGMNVDEDGDQEHPDTKSVEAGEAGSIASVIVDELVANCVDAAPTARDQPTRLSVATNESDDVKEYLVTESGDVRVALDIAIEEDVDEDAAAHRPAAVEHDDPLASVVAAVIDEVIESAISNAASTTAQREEKLGLSDTDLLIKEYPVTAREVLSKGYSTLTNPSSTDPHDQSTSTFDAIDETNNGEDCVWTYAVVGSSISEDDVVLYHIQITDGTKSKWPAPVQKRYSEFKQLRSKLKASGIEVTADFPPLPRAGFTQLVRGKLSKRTIAQREQQFTTILRFIAQHRGLHESAVFRSFIGQ